MINFNIDYDFSNLFDTKHKKKQIILCNTSSILEHHFIKLQSRFNGKYDRIPHYTISRKGDVYQHVNPELVTNFMSFEDSDNYSIIICLENIGWVEKDIKKNVFIDWKGDVYDDEITERSWKNKKHWATYTKPQIEVLLQLLNYLCDRYSIEKQFTGNNVTITRPKSFKGVLNRSNYNKNYYDLSPAMDFEYITNNLISNE